MHMNENDPIRFQTICNAYDIHKELVTYLMNDFGVEGKLSETDEWILKQFRTDLYSDSRKLITCLEIANAIYITNIEEYNERRLNMDRGIGYCNVLKADCQRVITTFRGRINVNKYEKVTDLILKEINMIKGWRKSDNKIKARITPTGQGC